MKDLSLIIIGASSVANSVIRMCTLFYPRVQDIICVDDDPQKRGTYCDKIPVQGSIDAVLKHTPSLLHHIVLITIPIYQKQYIRKLYFLLKKYNVHTIHIISEPYFGDDRTLHPSDIRPLTISDLIGHEYPYAPVQLSSNNYTGDNILVTGAGGSIGCEVLQQLLWRKPQKLILLDHSEDHLHSIYQTIDLLQKSGVSKKTKIIPLICNLRKESELQAILKHHAVQYLVHTAAYKHVYLMEKNAYQAILNNIVSTYHLLNTASQFNNLRFIHISTDKAVHPQGVYGASKLLAEWIALRFGSISKGVVIRLGNIAGSRGSLLPALEKNIPIGTIYITSKKAKRYFISLAMAGSFILKVLAEASPSYLYIPNMGTPLSIIKLAKEVITYLGFNPEKDIKIHITGLRPGEKETENVSYTHEIKENTNIQGILKIKGTHVPPYKELQLFIKSFHSLDPANDNKDHVAKNLLLDFIHRWIHEKI